MADDRRSASLEFAQRHLTGQPLTIEVASVDASFRSYWRVRAASASWIVMDAPTDKEDVRPWLDISARLRGVGLHAPQVLASDVNRGFVLMEDLGTRTYLPELNEANVDRLYAEALDALLRIQREADTAGLPVFDATRTIPEMELFTTWFLEHHLGVVPSRAQWDVIEDAFHQIAASADEQPRCFMHRDFHSRNLLVTPRNSPGIIDFQGAMLGPVAYDLASLLRDCYIDWPIERIDAWVEDYRMQLVAADLVAADSEQFRRWFDIIGLQRHIKVLGIFSRLCYRDGKPGYLGDLPRVRDYVLGVARLYLGLIDFADLIERAVDGRNVTQPRDAVSVPA